MDVACAGRCVENKVVERTPIGIHDELFERRCGHTTTPKCSGVGIDKEADAEQFHTIFLNRFNQLAPVFLNHIGTFIFHTEHFRHARAENVGV